LSAMGATVSGGDLFVDPNGASHVALETRSTFSQDTYSLSYATRGTGGWSVEAISPDVASVSPHGRIVVDAAGQPSVTYFRADGRRIGCARRVSGVWQIAALADDYHALGFAVAVDSMQQPCVAHNYFNPTPYAYEPTVDCLVNNSFQQTTFAPDNSWTVYGLT